MNRISLMKLRIGDRILIANLAAMGIVTILLVVAYIVSRTLSYDEALESKANAEYAKLYEAAEQAIAFQELDAMMRKANLIVDQDVVKYIHLYKLDDMRPVWSLENSESTSDFRVFEFEIVTSVYPDFDKDAEFHIDSFELEKKKIGLIKIAIATDIFQKAEIVKGFFFLSMLLLFSGIASFIGIWINRRSVLKPINDIHNALHQLGTGDLKTPIHQTDWSEIGDIQLSIEQVRQQLLELARRERAYLKQQIENQSNLERVSAANNYFIGSVGNQTIPSIHVIKNVLKQVSKKIIPTDPIVKPLLETAEAELGRIADKIDELVSAADSSIVNIQLNISSINVSQLLDFLINNCKFLATKQNISLTCSLRPNKIQSTYAFFSDPNKIKQILTTILNCIITRSANGNIVLDSIIHEERWFLKIIETSGVLNENELDRLFSTKRQVDRDAIGISAAMLLIERIGGTINVSSVRGRTTVIDLTFPSEHESFVNSSSHLRDVLPFSSDIKRKEAT